VHVPIWVCKPGLLFLNPGFRFRNCKSGFGFELTCISIIVFAVNRWWPRNESEIRDLRGVVYRVWIREDQGLILMEHLDAPWRIVRWSGRQTANKHADGTHAPSLEWILRQNATICGYNGPLFTGRFGRYLVPLEPARRPKLDFRLVQRVCSQTDISNDEITQWKTQWKMENTKPENYGYSGFY